MQLIPGVRRTTLVGGRVDPVGHRIEGWIEVTHDRPAELSEYSWSGVVRLPPLLEDYQGIVSRRLFGILSPDDTDVLAANRGIPQYPSFLVQEELKENAAVEAKHGVGQFRGYTYALWSEIVSFRERDPQFKEWDQMSHREPWENNWQVVFEIANSLVRSGGFSPDQIRFVVWFSW